MKKINYLTIIFMVLVSCPAAFAQKSPLKMFDFMIGTWEMPSKKGKIVEQWVRKPDQSLSGKSFQINEKGDSTLTESLVIKKVDEAIFYCSTVTGQNEGKEVCFKLVSIENKTYVFDNPAHDFPQQIVYQNKGKKQLMAWIEGMRKGQKRKSIFQYSRK